MVEDRRIQMTEAFEFGIRKLEFKRRNSEGGMLDFGLKRLSKETECIVNG
jgi:hypothetical protein